MDSSAAEFVTAADMGRAAGKVEDFQDSLDALARAAVALHGEFGGYSFMKPSRDGCSAESQLLRAGRVVGRADRNPVVTAKPLIAKRLNFPPAPAFDPVPFFDPSTTERYVRPISRGYHPDEVSELPPLVQVRANSSEKVALYRKLADSGRLRPIDSSSFHHGYCSGLFAVVKDQHRDRMILDGRPANLLTKGRCKTMASGLALSHLLLEDDKILVCSGLDLKDFFYQFTVGQERCERNALASPVSVRSEGNLRPGFFLA